MPSIFGGTKLFENSWTGGRRHSISVTEPLKESTSRLVDSKGANGIQSDLAEAEPQVLQPRSTQIPNLIKSSRKIVRINENNWNSVNNTFQVSERILFENYNIESKNKNFKKKSFSKVANIFGGCLLDCSC